MRRTALPVLIIVMITGGIFFMLPEMSPAGERGYQPLFQIMELSGAEITGAELHYWASLQQDDPRGFTERRDLESLAAELLVKLTGSTSGLQEAEAQTVGNAGSYVLYSGTGGGFYGEDDLTLVQREGKLGNGAQLKMLLQKLDREGRETVHLLLVISGQEPQKIAELAGRVPALLDGVMEESTLSFSLAGRLDRVMSGDEMERLAGSLIRDIGGTRGQVVADGRMVSATGYTPGLRGYFQAGSKRLNLNIALRGNDLSGGTLIWAGTPLIASWY